MKCLDIFTARFQSIKIFQKFTLATGTYTVNNIESIFLWNAFAEVYPTLLDD